MGPVTDNGITAAHVAASAGRDNNITLFVLIDNIESIVCMPVYTNKASFSIYVCIYILLLNTRKHCDDLSLSIMQEMLKF